MTRKQLMFCAVSTAVLIATTMNNVVRAEEPPTPTDPSDQPAKAEPAPFPDLATALDAYSNLRLSEGRFTVRDQVLTIGNLTLRLESGTAAGVMAGDRTAGFFFSGKGQLEFVTADRVEHSLLAYTTKKVTRLAAELKEGSFRVRDSFRTLLFLQSEGPPALPLSIPADSADLDKAFSDHRTRFLRDFSESVAQAFARRNLNARAGRRLVRVEAGGTREDLVHIFNRSAELNETLYCLRKPQSAIKEFRRRLYPVILSERPIGRDRSDSTTHPYDLTHVTLTLTAPGGKVARVSVTETVVPRVSGLAALRFSLYNHDYATTSALLLEERQIIVRSVTDAGGKALQFDHRKDILLVGLGRPAPKGKPLKLQFEIEGNFLIRPNQDSYWQLGPGPWLPLPEQAGERFTLRSTVRVKKPFVPFAPGNTISRREEGEYNVLETRVDKPVNALAILAGKYEYIEEKRGDLTIRVATYAGQNKSRLEVIRDIAFGMISFYEQFLGRFPFDEYNIIEIKSYGFGQAPPGMMFITQEVFNPMRSELAMIFSAGSNERFAHEIAHQYWGQAVNWSHWDEQWIAESFAEYCAALVIRAAGGDQDYRSLLRTWRARAKNSSAHCPIPLANRIQLPQDNSFASSKRFDLLYNKGPYLLATIHKEIGDEKFVKFLNSIQSSHQWSFTSTEQIRKILENVTGKDYSSFFEENYWGTGLPK